MNEEGNERGVTTSTGQYPPQNGTFQGCANYPPQPVMAFPPPSQPSNTTNSAAPPPLPQSYAPGNLQTGPGYPIAEERPAVREHDRLPFCGFGVGWFLFILGFFLGAITWYVGAIMLLCVRRRLDSREKSGYIACTISAVIASILIILGTTTRFHW